MSLTVTTDDEISEVLSLVKGDATDETMLGQMTNLRAAIVKDMAPRMTGSRYDPESLGVLNSFISGIEKVELTKLRLQQDKAGDDANNELVRDAIRLMTERGENSVVYTTPGLELIPIAESADSEFTISDEELVDGLDTKISDMNYLLDEEDE